MSAPRKTSMMSSREFNQNTSGAKRLAKDGPVFITDRGKPAYVLLTEAEYKRLKAPAKKMSLAEALSQPGGPEYDFEIEIPERRVERARFTFEDETDK